MSGELGALPLANTTFCYYNRFQFPTPVFRWQGGDSRLSRREVECMNLIKLPQECPTH